MKHDALIEEMPKGALAQAGGGLYSVTPRMPLGCISPEQLDIINSVVRDFNLPGVRVTAGQRLKLQGIPKDQVRAVIDRLGPVGEFCHYYVQACPGSATCRMGMRDSMAMGERLETFLNTVTLPCKLKAGVSGCSMCCAESYVRDVGLVGRNGGWTVLFGGNAGKRVRTGDVLAENVSDDEALAIIARVLDLYAREAKSRERTARFVERVGVEAVRRVVFGGNAP
ncbi:nitrite reductase [Pseudodesulfovibrio sp.]|uniref:nitrite reductase n=1 Tax=Pseudodesulfovibrio sp. TaxID=2035812 RepID=UPI00260CD7FA|nr:nitrite reductase [Pseudodesulfovibrio sp.]MDD3313097.1 nitrite reductase [Pseudodesulfovibrio sp.]